METKSVVVNTLLKSLKNMQINEEQVGTVPVPTSSSTPKDQNLRNVGRVCAQTLDASRFHVIPATPCSTGPHSTEMRKRRKGNMNRTYPYEAKTFVKARKSLAF